MVRKRNEDKEKQQQTNKDNRTGWKFFLKGKREGDHTFKLLDNFKTTTTEFLYISFRLRSPKEVTIIFSEVYEIELKCAIKIDN